MGTEGAPHATGEVREGFLGMVPQTASPLTCTIPEILLEGCQEPCLLGCTSLPESPAARCSVCRAKRIFRHASVSSGAASDPPRLLQEPAFLGRLSQKTNSKLFCQSKLRASHPAPGAKTLPEQLWLMPPGPLPFSPLLKRK